MNYGFNKMVNYSFDSAIEKVTEELKKEGFGVLTTIDVKDTLKKKIDVDFKKYTILGACNPKLAHQGLQTIEDLGLLLPCNVVVYEKDNGVNISIFDPMVMSELTSNQEIMKVATEVKQKLERVLAGV